MVGCLSRKYSTLSQEIKKTDLHSLLDKVYNKKSQSYD